MAISRGAVETTVENEVHKELTNREFRTLGDISDSDASEDEKAARLVHLKISPDMKTARRSLRETADLKAAGLFEDPQLQGRVYHDIGKQMEPFAKEEMEKKFPDYDWHMDVKSAVKGDQLDLLGIRKSNRPANGNSKYIIAEVKSGEQTHGGAARQLEETRDRIAGGRNEYILGNGRRLTLGENDIKTITIGNKPNFDIPLPTVQSYMGQKIGGGESGFGNSTHTQGGRSMNGAKINTDDLKKFVSKLQQFNSAIESETARIKGRASQLGSSWRDPSYGRFMNEFNQAVKGINDFLEASRGHVPRLQTKISQAEDAAR